MKIISSCARLAALPLALAAAFPSLAQTQLAPMIVTATRVAQPITDVVADVTLIDRAQIERSGAGGLADLLVRASGIAMTRNGGPGTSTSLYIRGAETRFTAVFVDGVRVDSQSTGGASWNALPLSHIDHIEILRGPAAAIYGSDAIGGVIQIFTRQGEAGFSPSVEIGAGNHGTYKLALGLSGGTDRVDYSLGLSREMSTGFNAQPTVNPDLDGYQNNSVSGRLGFKVNAAHRLEATFLRSEVDAQYDTSPPGVDDHSLARLQTVGLNWTARWSDAYSTRVSIGQSGDRYETLPSVYLTDTHVTSYLFHNEYRMGAHTLTADLERREDKLSNASTTPVVTNRSQDALAVGYGLRQGAHTLQLNARHDQDSEFGSNLTGSGAYAYAVTPAWRVTLAMGNAFRAPTLFQRFSQYGLATLTPETAKNREIGVKYDAAGESFSAVVYRNTVSDLINYVAGPGACANGAGKFPGCYGNTALAQYEGITFTASKRSGGVNWSGSVDFQNPRDLTKGKQLARRAKQMATLAADTQVSGWNLGGELQLTGERFNDAGNNQVLAGYSLLNLHASTALNREWTLLGRVNNLADQKYETAKGYATEGRTLYVGLKWSPV